MNSDDNGSDLFTSRGDPIPMISRQEALEKKLIPKEYVKSSPDRTVAYTHLITDDYFLPAEKAMLVRACEQLRGQKYVVVLQGKKAAIWRK